MSEITMPVYAIARHRLATDGEGITTLIASYGCPLKCKYCINPESWKNGTKIINYTCKQLYDKIKIDNLYFLATNGGVTFGGGEPLLHAEFIRAFRQVCKEDWRITIETSLNVSQEALALTIDVVDEYIIDIKDINESLYKRYTDSDNKLVLSNLHFLNDNVDCNKIIVKVPAIPNYNNRNDIENSIRILKEMGIDNNNIRTFHYIISDSYSK